MKEEPAAGALGEGSRRPLPTASAQFGGVFAADMDQRPSACEVSVEGTN